MSGIVKILTVVHRCRGTVLRPSTRRRREASVKVISGVNTEHNIWTQPCPSVGLQARKKVSDGGQGFLVLSSRPARGHSRQSGFYRVLRSNHERGTAYLQRMLLNFLHSRTAHRSRILHLQDQRWRHSNLSSLLTDADMKAFVNPHLHALEVDTVCTSKPCPKDRSSCKSGTLSAALSLVVGVLTVQRPLSIKESIGVISLQNGIDLPSPFLQKVLLMEYLRASLCRLLTWKLAETLLELVVHSNPRISSSLCHMFRRECSWAAL